MGSPCWPAGCFELPEGWPPFMGFSCCGAPSAFLPPSDARLLAVWLLFLLTARLASILLLPILLLSILLLTFLLLALLLSALLLFALLLVTLLLVTLLLVTLPLVALLLVALLLLIVLSLVAAFGLWPALLLIALLRFVLLRLFALGLAGLLLALASLGVHRLLLGSFWLPRLLLIGLPFARRLLIRLVFVRAGWWVIARHRRLEGVAFAAFGLLWRQYDERVRPGAGDVRLGLARLRAGAVVLGDRHVRQLVARLQVVLARTKHVRHRRLRRLARLGLEQIDCDRAADRPTVPSIRSRDRPKSGSTARTSIVCSPSSGTSTRSRSGFRICTSGARSRMTSI